MSLRGWGHSVGRLSPCTISRYLRNTQRKTRFSLKQHTHTFERRQTSCHPPYSNIYPITDLLITHYYKDKYTHLSTSWLSSHWYHKVYPHYPQLLSLTSGTAVSLCSQLALSGCCPVGEAAVIYHPTVKWWGLARRPGLISEIYSVQERLSRGKLCYKHHQLFIR